jgi:hypothetical protein
MESGTDFPGGDLSGIRWTRFLLVLVCAGAFWLGCKILSIPGLPQDNPLFGLGVALGGAGMIGVPVMLISFVSNCIWTLRHERSFRAKEAEWLEEREE